VYQKGRAWIELNLNNLAHNAAQLKRLLPDSCALMPAVKANAYGHGADTIARALERMGVTDFCVASVGEGIALRNAGITGQILVLSYTSPYQFSELRRYRLTQTVIDYDYARQLHAFGKPIDVHVGIDTGMHRLGERFDHPEKLLEIWKFKNLNITGVFSHLCAADGTSKAEKEYTKKQIQAFNHSISFLKQNGCSGFKTHIQSSYGVLNYPSLKYDFARVGIALYGCFCTPHDQTAADVTLRPVLSLKSRIECVKQLHAGESVGYGMSYTAAKDIRIAAVSIGYADGIPRGLSEHGYLLIRGVKAPMIGRICMDQLFADVSHIPSVSAGDEAVLIGTSGNETLTAGDLAECAGTISNEILSRLGNRLERIAQTA